MAQRFARDDASFSPKKVLKYLRRRYQIKRRSVNSSIAPNKYLGK
tara:strand:- start:356 stop:490 length:135 start_codon:yes stop_codon:yes gene_type:complete